MGCGVASSADKIAEVIFSYVYLQLSPTALVRGATLPRLARLAWRGLKGAERLGFYVLVTKDTCFES